VRGLLRGINTGMCLKRDLTDQQWEILDPRVPEPARRRDARGRPWKERRAVLNGILWVLRTGAPWVELPDRYSSHQTCHRRRWKIARLFAGLQNLGRLVVRYERYAENFLGMLHVACCLILLRHL